jgi:hypothetical protein
MRSRKVIVEGRVVQGAAPHGGDVVEMVRKDLGEKCYQYQLEGMELIAPIQYVVVSPDGLWGIGNTVRDALEQAGCTRDRVTPRTWNNVGHLRHVKVSQCIRGTAWVNDSGTAGGVCLRPVPSKVWLDAVWDIKLRNKKTA